MRRAAEGDAEAFGDIVRRHQQTVYATIVRMLGSAEGAEDLAQEVFLRAWKSARRFRPAAKVSTWLLTIARNLVFNECRRRRRARMQALEEPAAGTEFPMEPAEPSGRHPASEAALRELSEAVEKALAALPEPARLAVVLRRYEEMPYEEIARVLGLSVPAVKSLLFRARQDLRERLAPWL